MLEKIFGRPRSRKDDKKIVLVPKHQVPLMQETARGFNFRVVPASQSDEATFYKRNLNDRDLPKRLKLNLTHDPSKWSLLALRGDLRAVDNFWKALSQTEKDNNNGHH